MHKANLSAASLIVIAWISLGAHSSAQAALQTSQTNANAPFLAINATLDRAAEGALETSGEMVGDSIADPKNNEASAPTESSHHSGSDPVDPLIESILAREGVPPQLAAVAKVESSGNPFALSPKGARGLWQLMPETARRYGLQVNSWVDERTSVERSTTAAARYLRDLYAQFGSWPLALAAYNSGEASLQRAISRANSNQFVVLSALGVIPMETRNYVPAVLARVGLSSSFQNFNKMETSFKTLVYAESRSDADLPAEAKR